MEDLKMESHIKADIEREVYAHNVLNRFKNHIEAPLKEVFKPFEGQNVRRKDETLLAKVKKPLDEKLAELRESFEIKPFFKDGWVKLDAYVKSLASFDVQIVLRLNFQTGVNERSGYSLDAHAFKDDVLYIASVEWSTGLSSPIAVSEHPVYDVEDVARAVQLQNEAYEAFKAAREAVPLWSVRRSL
jgi:hypothetical protein